MGNFSFMPKIEAIISPVDPYEPASRVYYFLQNLTRERRYMRSDGDGGKVPEPYMVNHFETVYDHLTSIVRKTRGLFQDMPVLRESFDEDGIVEILWLHEAEEILNGDQSWGEQFTQNGLAGIGGVGQDNAKDEAKKEELLYVFNALFQDDENVELWTDTVMEFDNWKRSSNPAILFAKLIDVLHGNQSVLDHGNDLEKHAEVMSQFVGHRLNELMNRLSQTAEMQAHPDVFIAIEENMVGRQIEEYRKKGVEIQYTPFAVAV